MKNKSGSTPFFILILIGIGVLVLSGVAYYYLQFTGKMPSPVYNTTNVEKVNQVDETGVSNSDDVETIEVELNDTDIGSIDDDMEEIQLDIDGL